MRITVCCCRRYVGEGLKLLLGHELRTLRPAIRVCWDPRSLLRDRSDLLIIDYPLLTALPSEILDKVGVKTLLLGTCCASLMEKRRLAVLISMGLIGIVPANASAATLRKTVLAACSGTLLFSSTQVRSLLYASDGSAEDAGAPTVAITAREWEVVRLLCRGHRNKAIMERLDLSEQAVKSHLSRIGRKFGVTDRLQIVLYALRHWPQLREDADEVPAPAAGASAGATFVAPVR